jgi:hypothetical protein
MFSRHLLPLLLCGTVTVSSVSAAPDFSRCSLPADVRALLSQLPWEPNVRIDGYVEDVGPGVAAEALVLAGNSRWDFPIDSSIPFLLIAADQIRVENGALPSTISTFADQQIDGAPGGGGGEGLKGVYPSGVGGTGGSGAAGGNGTTVYQGDVYILANSFADLASSSGPPQFQIDVSGIRGGHGGPGGVGGGRGGRRRWHRCRSRQWTLRDCSGSGWCWGAWWGRGARRRSCPRRRRGKRDVHRPRRIHPGSADVHCP